MRNHKQNWLDIFSGFRIALDARKIILGMFGLYATVVLVVAVFLFVPVLFGTVELGSRCQEVFDRAEKLVQNPAKLVRGDTTIKEHPYGKLGAVGERLIDAARHPLRGPEKGPGYMELTAFAGTAVLYLILWSLVGGAMARLAAVDFARDQRLSVAEAFSFAKRKFGSFFWSLLIPLIFIAIFLLCNVILGLIGRISGLGPIAVGVLFALAQISSFLALLLAIGGFFGAIFMWPTIAMEGSDAFDAVSRSFAYVFARPWKVIWCCLVSMVYSIVCVAFAAVFTYGLLKIAQFSVGLGLGGSNNSVILDSLFNWGITPRASIPQLIGLVLVRVVFLMTWGLLGGFLVSMKISELTGIYAVLRRDVDGTDMSEVFLPEPEEEPAPAPAEQSSPVEPSAPPAAAEGEGGGSEAED